MARRYAPRHADTARSSRTFFGVFEHTRRKGAEKAITFFSAPLRLCVRFLRHPDFGFVSDFEFRIFLLYA
jgi:hypothetical protein